MKSEPRSDNPLKVRRNPGDREPDRTLLLADQRRGTAIGPTWWELSWSYTFSGCPCKMSSFLWNERSLRLLNSLMPLYWTPKKKQISTDNLENAFGGIHFTVAENRLWRRYATGDQGKGHRSLSQTSIPPFEKSMCWHVRGTGGDFQTGSLRGRSMNRTEHSCRCHVILSHARHSGGPLKVSVSRGWRTLSIADAHVMKSLIC